MFDSKNYSGIISLSSGALAGTVGTVITFPLDVLKTRLQSSLHYSISGNVYSVNNKSLVRNNIFTNIYFSLRQIKHSEGFRGLFKGLNASLLGIVPSRSIYFFSYTWARNEFAKFNNDNKLRLPHVVASAAFGGFTTSSIMNPVWVLKTRFQLDRLSNSNQTIVASFRKIYYKEGMKAFYRGLSATYLGITETVIFFSLYEHLCANFIPNKDEASGFKRTLLSASAKAIACLVAYPHEVLRTRVREENPKYKTLRRALPGILSEEGVLALYRGLGTHFVRQVPNAAITLTVFETAIKYMSK